MYNLITHKDVKQNENTLYYFRKTYTVNEITESKINIFADSRYKLYINGKLAAIGPLRASSEVKFFDTVDITKYLKKGENVFEVAVLQLASKPYSEEYRFLEAILRSGGMSLAVWGNAGDNEVITDDEWLVAKETGLEFIRVPSEFFAVASLNEKVTEGYRKPVYEKAAYAGNLYSLCDETGHCAQIVHPVRRRTIPMMFFDEKEFATVKNGIYDAGQVTCGYVRFKLSGKGSIKLTYAESMVVCENGKYVKRRRDDENGIVTGDYDIINVDGECDFETFWMRTFRYIKAEITGNVEVIYADYIETGYPISIPNDYDFGNETDNKLFEISANTLKRCMHETYCDCPYYEQLQYTMDTHLQILFTYQLSTDKRLAEKAIDDFAQSYRPGGLTQSRFPTNKAQYIPGFSLFYIFMMYEHSKRFSDKAFTRRYIHIADGIIDWFFGRLDGYLVKRSNLWDFIDWSEGYNKSGMSTAEGPITVYSLMLIKALENLCEMHEFLGNTLPDYKAVAEKIRKDIKSRCYDENSGLYASSPEKDQFAQHTQIWAVLCGLEEGENAKRLLEKSFGLKCKVTYANMYYLLRAMELAGMYDKTDEAIADLKKLPELGCTTVPEWYGEDVRSECHAWSAVVLYEYTARVLGVTYRDGTIYIKPYIKGRNCARGSVATPQGMVFVEWKTKGSDFNVQIKLPENLTAELTMPNGETHTAVSGRYSCENNFCILET